MCGRTGGYLCAIALVAVLSAPSGSQGATHPKRCDRYHSGAALGARVIARSAETAAETYATDHNGDYTGLTSAKLQAIEPTIPTSRYQALRKQERAYLLSPKATSASYVVTVRTLRGDTYSIERRSDGSIERRGRECGIGVYW
jgi:hypothetical protein